MSAKPWWAMTLQWALWSLWMTAMMSWLGRSRLRRRSSADANTLYHPRSTLILGVACLVVFVAFTLFFVVVALASKVTAMGWGTALFAGFALLSASSVLDYFMAFHRISDDGLAYRGMFGRTGSLRWSELRSVRYGSSVKWFRIEGRNGEVARISAMLTGLPELARALLRSTRSPGRMNATDAAALRGNYRKLPSRPSLFLAPLPTIRSLIFPNRSPRA